MPTSQQRESSRGAARLDRRGVWLALGVTWLAAVQLRTGLIGVGPILPELTGDLGLSQTQGSVLVALPTALMGLAAVPGGRLADRWGARATISVGLALVAFAGGLRAAAPEYGLLILLTVLFGVGIGITQPALPRLAQGLLPGRIGVATGVYAGGFFAGAVLAAFLTGPVLLPLANEWSWRLPLATWGALALLGLAAWSASLPRWRLRPPSRSLIHGSTSDLSESRHWSPWRDRWAWLAATLFAGQGLAYYLLIAWLPSVYDGLGLDPATSGGLFAVFNLATFPAMVGLPALSDRLGTRRLPTALTGAVFLIGALGLALAAGDEWWRWLWPTLAGFGLAGLFAMTLVLPTDVAPPGRTATAAGMVLGIGYLGSALGPVVGGAVQDLTGSFAAALATLPVLGVLMFLLALLVPRRGRPEPSPAAHRVGHSPERTTLP